MHQPSDLGGLLQGGAAGVYEEPGHVVRVDVRVGAAVLDVALLVDRYLPGNADRGAAVGYAVAVDVVPGGLVVAGQALFDPVAVHGDVLVDLARGTEGFAGGEDRVVP